MFYRPLIWQNTFYLHPKKSCRPKKVIEPILITVAWMLSKNYIFIYEEKKF